MCGFNKRYVSRLAEPVKKQHWLNQRAEEHENTIARVELMKLSVKQSGCAGVTAVFCVGFV